MEWIPLSNWDLEMLVVLTRSTASLSVRAYALSVRAGLYAILKPRNYHRTNNVAHDNVGHNHKDDGVDSRSQNGRLAGHEEALGAGGDSQKNAGR